MSQEKNADAPRSPGLALAVLLVVGALAALLVLGVGQSRNRSSVIAGDATAPSSSAGADTTSETLIGKSEQDFIGKFGQPTHAEQQSSSSACPDSAPGRLPAGNGVQELAWGNPLLSLEDALKTGVAGVEQAWFCNHKAMLYEFHPGIGPPDSMKAVADIAPWVASVTPEKPFGDDRCLCLGGNVVNLDAQWVKHTGCGTTLRWKLPGFFVQGCVWTTYTERVLDPASGSMISRPVTVPPERAKVVELQIGSPAVLASWEARRK